jgi:hypothetical protein
MLVKLPQLQSSQRITPKDTGIVHCKVRFPKIMRGSVSWPFLFQKKMLFIIPSVCWWNLRFRWCNCHFGCLDNILTSLNQFACTGKQQITFFEWFSPGDILSDIYSDILSGILSGILSHMYSDILSALLADMLSHIYSDVLTGVLSGIYSHILSGILSGILSDIYSDILSGILADILSNLYSDMPHDIKPGILSDILFGVCSGPCVPKLSWSSRW